MEEINVTELHKIAPGLNIEGGYPLLDLLKTNNNGIWANIVLVLDRPLIDDIIFDDILKNNKYPLLENAIHDINEHKFLVAFLITTLYYIEHAQELTNKDNNVIIT